jgi:hypothetical protein
VCVTLIRVGLELDGLPQVVAYLDGSPNAFLGVAKVAGMRRWREWEQIGASGQIVNWIRHGVWVKFKHGLRPRPFNHGVSMIDAILAQQSFLATKLPYLEARTQLLLGAPHVPSPQVG